MLKTLTARAIVPEAVAVTGFVIVCCILLFSYMKTDMTNDNIKHETNLADTVIKSTRFAMLKSDRETLGNIIKNVGDLPGVEHVRIFNKKGLIMFTKDQRELNRFVDKKTAGCISCHAGPVATTTLGSMERARRYRNEAGLEVLAITAPIYNEPACYTSPCHFHTADQKILGTLDIGLSVAPLIKTLSVMRWRMAIFSLLVLFLTIGGVAALLQRQVFIPLRIIKEFTANIKHGNLNQKLSGVSGELNDLADDIRSVATRLRNAEEELARLKKPQE